MPNMQTRSAVRLHTRVRIAAAAANTMVAQVVQKIGLCISLYDVLWTSEGLIGHGTGLVNVNGMVNLAPFHAQLRRVLTQTQSSFA